MTKSRSMMPEMIKVGIKVDSSPEAELDAF
jgi:hypothetical protein